MSIDETTLVRYALAVITFAFTGLSWVVRLYTKKIDDNKSEISMNRESIIKLEGKNELYDEMMRSVKDNADKTEKSVSDINDSITAIKIMLAKHIAIE